MNVYFARSLRGDRTGSDDVIYRAIAAVIKTAGHHTQFEIPVSMDRLRIVRETYIYKRDLLWIDQCQAMIAEVTNASHGVGYEIAYAKHVRNLPIFCVAQKDTGPHSAMITGGLDVVEYRDSGDLTYYIEEWLGNLNV